MTLLLVAVGGAVGALARYLIDLAIAATAGRAFPWGTLMVNVLGCFVLGATLGRADPATAALVGTGFCGALTTYSSFAGETLGLLDDRRPAAALANVVLSLALGLAACLAGIAI